MSAPPGETGKSRGSLVAGTAETQPAEMLQKHERDRSCSAFGTLALSTTAAGLTAGAARRDEGTTGPRVCAIL